MQDVEGQKTYVIQEKDDEVGCNSFIRYRVPMYGEVRIQQRRKPETPQTLVVQTQKTPSLQRPSHRQPSWIKQNSCSPNDSKKEVAILSIDCETDGPVPGL